MTPTECYDALIGRITTWAVEEECGQGKMPDQKQKERITTRVLQTLQNAQIFHIDPYRHQKQSWFLRARAPILIACTGNKFGKTFANLIIGAVASLKCVPWAPREAQDEAYEIFRKIKPEYDPPITITLAGPDFVKWLPMNIIPRLKKLLPWDALITRVNRQQGNVIDGFELWNGTSWQILSCSGDTERFEGWSTHLMLWDEPMTREKFIAASRGCVEFGAPHVMSFTPENLRDAFVVDELVLPSTHITKEEEFQALAESKPTRILIEGSIFDNPFIDEADKQVQVSLWNPEERESRVYGRLRFFSGRVYKNFERARHVRSLELMCTQDEFDRWPKGLSVDPADAKSFFLGWFAVNPRNELIFFYEFPEADFYETRYQLGTQGYLQAILDIEKGDNHLGRPFQNVFWRFLDPNFGPTKKATTGQSLQDEFADLGMWFDCQINDDVSTGHIAVRDRLEAETLIFTPQCRNLIEAMERYIYKRGRNDTQERVTEKVEEAYKDGADVVRYTVMKNPAYFSIQDVLPRKRWVENGGFGRPRA